MEVYGVDLALWYAEGRVDGLVDLIDNLPSASRFTEAVSNDPEAAELLARHRLSSDDDKADWSPRVAEFGLTQMLLRDLIHEVRIMRSESVKMQGGKPGEMKPVPGPRTAIDVVMDRLEQEATTDLLSRFGFDESDI